MGFFAPPKPVVPPAPPKIDDQELEDARRRERLARQNRLGRASTILTSGSGVNNSGAISRKKLLGE